MTPWDREPADKRTTGRNGTRGTSIPMIPWVREPGNEDKRDKWDQGNKHPHDPKGQEDEGINGTRGTSIPVMAPRSRGPGDKWDTKTRGTNGTRGMSISVTPWDMGTCGQGEGASMCSHRTEEQGIRGTSRTMALSIPVTPEGEGDKWNQGREHPSDPMGQGTTGPGGHRDQRRTGGQTGPEE